ncbi:aminotriazole resistance protein [Kluyveromyces marxianus DMKU3-1042]|uniref:Aminotriazole resistance protein n=1 Tax=Kluyveromyces marxianus (strain DMKU3-1042 / BCC 29191 / NBRC 104275) TaxID=1003335 RepID=W0TB45_KLUMD|nr:aminotriazole resistance protein [Kluyveromyces marxianus DMKU3-1042]XP_022676476.1 aminotriazole resistance protein [Kluyveromyces marxianus DMKU3-1042]BAO39296.1 aminotriazole resistance protein [Kluyveromyces marxianus DMKU3-1042]BAO40655.1 aminotriazole resistance protein [Kluyveromyces marxianus DMKU3-1042]
MSQAESSSNSLNEVAEKEGEFPIESIFHPNRLKHFKFLCILTALALDFMSLGAMIVLVQDVEKRFNISATKASWSLTSYVITFAGFIAFFGRVGDIVGNGMMMSISIGVFGICSLLCAVIPNFVGFAVFRAFQGMAGAGIVPCSYALVNSMFAGENLQRYFSILSSIGSGTIGVGFVIGGAFAETKIGYKALFYMVFGASILTCMLILLLIGYPEYVRVKSDYSARFKKVTKLDVIGSFTFISGSVLLVVALTDGGDSWKKPSAYVPLVISIILMAAFFAWNLGYQKVLSLLKPHISTGAYKYMESVSVLIPKELLYAHNFAPVLLVSFFAFAAFMVVMYTVVNYSISVEGDAVIVAAVKIMPLIVGLMLANTTIALHQTILKPKNGLIVGTFVCTLGCAFLTALKEVNGNLYWKLLLLSAFLAGVGGAVYFSYMLSMAIGDAPMEYKALAGGVVQTASQFGNEVALSVIVSLLGNGKTNRKELRRRYQNVGYFAIACAAMAFISAITTLRDQLEPSGDEEQQNASVHSVKGCESDESTTHQQCQVTVVQVGFEEDEKMKSQPGRIA